MKMDYEVDFSKLHQKIEQTFDEDAGLQTFIDETVIKICDPYVPKRDGNIIQSAIDNTVPGSGEIDYSTPYARAHYYAPYKDAMWNWNEGVQRGGKRGHYWVDRAMEDGGLDQLTKESAGYIERNLK